jgi:GNAT superfamily N-acetyltransferase
MTAPPAIRFRHGVAADAVTLSGFMRHAFTSAFGALNDPEHLAVFLADSYTPARQAAELADPAIATLIAEVDGGLAGYAQVKNNRYVPESVTGPSPIELARFYVDPARIGGGIAWPLMERAKDEARQRGGKTFWLGAWEINARAIAFYRKAGFEPVGKHTFRVGGDEQVDLVMVTALASS